MTSSEHLPTGRGSGTRRTYTNIMYNTNAYRRGQQLYYNMMLLSTGNPTSGQVEVGVFGICLRVLFFFVCVCVRKAEG